MPLFPLLRRWYAEIKGEEYGEAERGDDTPDWTQPDAGGDVDGGGGGGGDGGDGGDY